MGSVCTGDLDPAVERGDERRQRVDLRSAERPARERATRERVLRKLAHPDRVFDRRTRAAEGGPVGGPGDRDDVEIELRREAPVQRELELAVPAALVERREVREAQLHRLLELVGVAAGQEHVRNVRLDQLDALDAGAVHRGIAQRGDESPVILRRALQGTRHSLHVAPRAHARVDPGQPLPPTVDLRQRPPAPRRATLWAAR